MGCYLGWGYAYIVITEGDLYIGNILLYVVLSG